MLQAITKYCAKAALLLSMTISQPSMGIFAAPLQPSNPPQYASVVKLQDYIFDDALTAQFIRDLEQAFYDPQCAEIILYFESPGGEWRTCARIYNKIKKLKQATKKRVYAFTSKICASGAYLLACAADIIVCSDEVDAVGSVGAIITLPNTYYADKMKGLQFTSLSSSETKSAYFNIINMDPQSAEFKAAVKIIQEEITALGNQFVDLVVKERGPRMKITREELAKAGLYDAKTALEYGLVDEIMDGARFMREYCQGLFAVEQSQNEHSLTYKTIVKQFLNSKTYLLSRIGKQLDKLSLITNKIA